MSDFRHPRRMDGLRALLDGEKLDATIVSYLENVRYLTGFLARTVWPS